MIEPGDEHWLSQLGRDNLKPLHCLREQTVFHQGEAPAGVWFVQQGEVLMERISEQGRCIPIHRARAGNTFAEASVFVDAMHCRAVALSDACLLLAPTALIQAALSDSPDFARAFCQGLAVDVRLARARIEVLNRPTAQERVLLEFEQNGQAGRAIVALAADIGLSAEATSRALRELCDAGRLRRVGRGSYCLPS